MNVFTTCRECDSFECPRKFVFITFNEKIHTPCAFDVCLLRKKWKENSHKAEQTIGDKKTWKARRKVTGEGTEKLFQPLEKPNLRTSEWMHCRTLMLFNKIITKDPPHNADKVDPNLIITCFFVCDSRRERDFHGTMRSKQSSLGAILTFSRCTTWNITNFLKKLFSPPAHESR